MDDDFNTAGAIGVLQKLRAKVNAQMNDRRMDGAFQAKEFIEVHGKILGLFQVPIDRWSFQPWETRLSMEPALSEATVQELIREREEAREKKEWAKSDQIRDRLAKAGVIIEDRPDGTTRIKR